MIPAGGDPATSPRPDHRPPRRWAPHFVEGTDIFTWLRMLGRCRGRIHPRYGYVAAIVSVMSTLNWMVRHLRHGLYGDVIRRTPLPQSPLFILGHWRTGTTLLHELLACDPQFSYPDFFACFNPNQVLMTEGFFKNYARWLAPERRPMDNMPVGWDKPQEDEFALCLLGAPSPYWDMVFPQAAPVYPGSLDLRGLPPHELRRWKRIFVNYLQLLAFRDPRPPVLKSPPHTARVPVLLELFPRAKFVHIVRDPCVVIPSTIRMVQAMTRQHCLQQPPGDPVERVFANFAEIYQRLEEARPLLRPASFYEMKYEDLVRQPLESLRRLYTALELDGFEQARPHFQRYLHQTDGYETNKYQLTPELATRIRIQCAEVIARYGYTPVR